MVTLMVYTEKGNRDILVFNNMILARIHMLKEYERVSAVYKNAKLGEDYLSYGNEAGLILRENQIKLSLSCSPKDYADKDMGLITSGAYSLVRTHVLEKCVQEWKRISSLMGMLISTDINIENVDTMLRENYKKIVKIANI